MAYCEKSYSYDMNKIFRFIASYGFYVKLLQTFYGFYCITNNIHNYILKTVFFIYTTYLYLLLNVFLTKKIQKKKNVLLLYFMCVK